MPFYYQIDQADMVQSFNRAAPHYEAVALIQHEIGNRLFDRLEYIKIEPNTIVDLGCSSGYYLAKLALLYPQATLIGIDLAEQMLASAAKKSLPKTSYRCEDAQHTTLADHSVDLIFSNLLFQWCDAQQIIAECKRLLAPNGLLLFTSLGPDSLYELRACWKKLDQATHVNPFLDMHHVGDYLNKAAFVDPVVDSEYLTATFNDLTNLMYSLKIAGAHNVNTARNRGLTGKYKFQQLCQHYEAYRDEEGLLPITYEVVYGHAWQSNLIVQQSVDAAGNVRVPASSLKKLRQ